jgi:hypothetical protein
MLRDEKASKRQAVFGGEKMKGNDGDATIARRDSSFSFLPEAPMTWHRFSLFSSSFFLFHPIYS